MSVSGRESIIAAPAESCSGRPERYDVLFDQIRIGPKVMKNRFYQTPHCTSLGTQRPGAQARLRGTKAEGGWAVVNTEYCSVHPESDGSPSISATIWDQSDVRNLSAMTAAVHEHDALAGVQLWYGGVLGTNFETREVSRGVSQIPSDAWPAHSCYAMNRAEIRELQGFFVDAALRAVDAGFDIISLGAEEAGNIFLEFIMSFYNHRTDEYGGELENRARFLLETLEMVREAVGDRCAVTCRLCIDTLDNSERGMRSDVEGAGVVALADHLVDFWDVQVGGWSSARWGEDAMPSRFSNENFQGAWLEPIRKATDKPLVAVGRFTSPDTMASVIRSGQQDIIGAARPSIADPFIPRKVETGRFEDIRECIGCNVCAARHHQSTPIVCTQNPTLGEEYRRGWHPERMPAAPKTDSPILIVGAGPAGLECAVSLGKRGFEHVHLVDADAKPGGSLKWIARLPGLAEWIRVIDYRREQIARLSNVEFIPSKELDLEGILDYGGTIVINATGSRWAGEGMNWATHEKIVGADASLDHVFTPEQLMVEGQTPVGESVAVYDCDGYFTAVGLAERLHAEGRQVKFVSPFDSVAPSMEHTFEALGVSERFDELGIEQVLGVSAEEVTPEGLTCSRLIKRDQPQVVAADSTVLVTHRVSSDGLYRQLEAAPEKREAAAIDALYRIGDCVVPRLIADAVFDGHRLAREIDSPEPARPLPFIRETRKLRDDGEIQRVALGREE